MAYCKQLARQCDDPKVYCRRITSGITRIAVMRLADLFQHGTTERRFLQTSLRSALFSAMLLLGAYLRVTGLSWGLNSGYGHDLNFQPDEFVSLRGVLQLDLLAG